MTKRVLDVGQCDLDHGNISNLLSQNFGATVDRAHLANDAIDLLQQNQYDLVLINRLLDRDHSEGKDLLATIKSSEQLKQTAVMLVTNFPEHQEHAVQSGAVLGFGKAELDRPETIEKLSAFLAG